MGVVHTSSGSIKPTSSDLLSEIEIVSRMALETLEAYFGLGEIYFRL